MSRVVEKDDFWVKELKDTYGIEYKTEVIEVEKPIEIRTMADGKQFIIHPVNPKKDTLF